MICADIFSTALLVRALGSWFIGPLRHTVFGKIYELLCAFTEPLVSPVRKFMSTHLNTGMFDFSILVTMVLVEFVARVAVRMLMVLA